VRCTAVGGLLCAPATPSKRALGMVGSRCWPPLEARACGGRRCAGCRRLGTLGSDDAPPGPASRGRSTRCCGTSWAVGWLPGCLAALTAMLSCSKVADRGLSRASSPCSRARAPSSCTCSRCRSAGQAAVVSDQACHAVVRHTLLQLGAALAGDTRVTSQQRDAVHRHNAAQPHLVTPARLARRALLLAWRAARVAAGDGLRVHYKKCYTLGSNMAMSDVGAGSSWDA
jgi:hypothetical protein